MNIRNLLGLASLGLTAALVAACSGASAPTTSESDLEEKAPAGGETAKAPANGGADKGGTPAKGGTPPATPADPGQPGQPGQPGEPGQPGQPGQPGRISVNEHCCYGSQYFKCPNEAACFGGFDISACLDACSGPEDPCFDACFDKLDTAGAPKGCQSNVTPPKGVDCANGSISL
jgi:hypothetical protein